MYYLQDPITKNIWTFEGIEDNLFRFFIHPNPAPYGTTPSAIDAPQLKLDEEYMFPHEQFRQQYGDYQAVDATFVITSEEYDTLLQKYAYVWQIQANETGLRSSRAIIDVESGTGNIEAPINPYV